MKAGTRAARAGVGRASLAGVLAAVFSVLLPVGAAHAAPVLDQENAGARAGGAPNGMPVAQIITAGSSGALTSVEADLALVGPATGCSLGLQIRMVESGLPGDTVLASRVFPAGLVADDFLEIEFDRPATVSAGEQYAIVIENSTGGCIANWIRGDGSYGGGGMFHVSGGEWVPRSGDARFRTYVDGLAAGCPGGAGDAAALADAIDRANSTPGADTVTLYDCTYALDAADNHWYGPNALPAIASEVTIEGNGARIERSSADGVPSFRFFFVGADPARAETLGYTTPGAGALTLRQLTLANGLAEGGDGISLGAGGAGLGGAIFNQGRLTLEGVTATANTARGGAGAAFPGGPAGAGGGIGTDATLEQAGGFGPGSFGGAAGGAGAAGGGGGGGGFVGTEAGANGAGGTGGAGGGPASGLGGNGSDGTNGPDAISGGNGSGGGAGGDGDGNDGGAFGAGGGNGPLSPGGGGGVGGGGGTGAGGGFGGGGGLGGGGGFGGGAGAVVGTPADLSQPGFGGGAGGSGASGEIGGGGGAGMGGVIFNHQGIVTVTSSTLSGNAAIGGSGAGDAGTSGARGEDGQGLGGAIFNLNGRVDGTSATIADNAAADGGGAIYSLSYSANEPRSALIDFDGALLADTPDGAVDFMSNRPDDTVAGPNHADNDARLFFFRSLLEAWSRVNSAFTLGNMVEGADPQLRPLGDYGGLTETRPLRPTSPAIDASDAFGLATDQRGRQRIVDHPEIPNRFTSPGADIGAFELQDVTAPTLAITGGPDGPTAEVMPTFTFDAEVGSSVRCSIDTGTPNFGPCSEAAAHTPAGDLAEGDHTFRVEATDSEGNETVVTRHFTVDTTPPALTIDSGPAGATHELRPTFTFTAEPGAAVECSLDSGAPAYGPCSAASSHQPEVDLAPGAYTFRVKARDAVGNVAEATRAFAVELRVKTECKGRPATIYANEGEVTRGTDGPDVIIGSAGPDEIHAGGGEDIVCALGGDDVIDGEGGADLLRGGAGADRISGGAGRDRLQGQAGRDRLSGGAGKDTLRGGAGNDRLDGGPGQNKLFGGKGSNSCRNGIPKRGC